MSIMDLNYLQKIDPMLKNIDFKLKDLQLRNKKITNNNHVKVESLMSVPRIIKEISKGNKFTFPPSRTLGLNNLEKSNPHELIGIISKRKIEDLLYPRKCGTPLRS